MIILFGITVTKELRQFHSLSGITHRSWLFTFIWVIDPKKYKKDEVKIKNAVLYKAPVGLFTGLENSF